MYTFIGTCIGGEGDLLKEMEDSAVEVSYRTIVRHLGRGVLANMFPYYKWVGTEQNGNQMDLLMSDDYAVTYYKSKYNDRPCYYIDHGAIFYIFCAGQEGEEQI
jgi:hypothetical protein